MDVDEAARILVAVMDEGRGRDDVPVSVLWERAAARLGMTFDHALEANGLLGARETEVRTEMMRLVRERLDLAAEFEEAGRSYSEADENGVVILREPGKPSYRRTADES